MPGFGDTYVWFGVAVTATHTQVKHNWLRKNRQLARALKLTTIQ